MRWLFPLAIVLWAWLANQDQSTDLAVALQALLDATRETTAGPSAAARLSQVDLPPPPVATWEDMPASKPPVPAPMTSAGAASARRAALVAAATRSSATGGSITFQWPEDGRDRVQVRRVLHQCLGVRLARLDSAGQVAAIEAPGLTTAVSQYARVFEAPMAPEDARFVNETTGAGGRIVRLYPASLDQALFRFVGATADDVGEAAIRGQFRWAADSLMMTGVVVDGKPRPGMLRLYRARAGGCQIRQASGTTKNAQS